MKLEQLQNTAQLAEATYDMETETTAKVRLTFDISFSHEVAASELIEQAIDKPELLQHLKTTIAHALKAGLGTMVRKAESDVSLGDRWIDDLKATGAITKM